MGRFDVVDTDEILEYRAALPEFDGEEIEVRVDGSQLTVLAYHEAAEAEEGEEEDEELDDEGVYAFSETSDSFIECFTLPPDADDRHVEASFDNGVLVVRVAKKPEYELGR